jgi:hypothetical protein
MTFVPPDGRASARWKLQPADLSARPNVRFGMLDGLLDVGIAFDDSTRRPDTLVQSTGSAMAGEMSTALPAARAAAFAI